MHAYIVCINLYWCKLASVPPLNNIIYNYAVLTCSQQSLHTSTSKINLIYMYTTPRWKTGEHAGYTFSNTATHAYDTL